MLNIFHVSDLHFTAQPRGRVRDAAVAAVAGILKLAKDLKSQGVLGQDLCLCITGDLVQSGSPAPSDSESDFAAVQREFLQPLLDVLELDPSAVFIVPGNHEMDREAVPEANRLAAYGKKICEGDLHDDLRTKLDEYFTFVAAHGYNSVTSQNPRLALFKHGEQTVACFNGLAGAYSRAGSGDKGELFILPSEIGGTFAAIPDFSLVLLHHPLSWFSDKSGIDLKELLASRRCRLMTGHIHDQGLDWLQTQTGNLAVIQAGASAENGESNQVAVAWLPKSDSVAVRHYTFNPRAGQFDLTPSSDTKVAPQGASNFFQRSEAFFDPAILKDARKQAREDCDRELRALCGRSPDKFVCPDLVLYSEDQFSAKRVKFDSFLSDSNRRVLSGDELSGKTSFSYYCAFIANGDDSFNGIGLVIDYRALSTDRDIDALIIERLQSFGLTKAQGSYILDVGLVDLWFDNFDPDQEASLAKFNRFFQQRPSLAWSAAMRGGQRYLPSQAPSSFPKEGISYYELSEVTLPTVLTMIEEHKDGAGVERPRAVVERVFRSINNLRAPRTVFYVDSLVDMFLSDGSVEPLNRYLLIENLLSEKIRQSHKARLPNQAVDMDMLETFIGQIAHYLLENEKPYISKAEYYRLAEQFIERKGLQPKRFDPDSILHILTDSFVLRNYYGSFGFMMMSVEDYFLAKHMGRDEEFRRSVMSEEGLLTLPSVAEYYIAQNPSDRARIDQIFEIIDNFENEVWPLLSQVSETTLKSIQNAVPGSPSALQEEIIEELSEIEAPREDEVLVVSQNPQQLGKTKRLKFSTEERGAVFLQLGASILGVTRTLDQSERIEIFKRLRKVLMISLTGVPLIAQHLADGGEVKFRGTTVKADYVGKLAIPEERFYIILRGMIYNVMKHFATWAGSPSFFNASVKLREEETEELIRSALFAQNIEADLAEAIHFIPEIGKTIDSVVLKEIVIRLFLDAMTLVPLERKDEQKAIDSLVEATVEIGKPEGIKNNDMMNVYKNKLRQDYTDKIGLNTYMGKLVKPKGT